MIFFSRTKVLKLNLCWSILVVSDDYLPMRDLCSLVKWSDHGIPSNFLQRAQLGIPTPSWHIYLCGSGDVSIFPDIWKCWSSYLGHSQLSPDINRVSTMLDNHWFKENVSTRSTTSAYRDCSLFYLEVHRVWTAHLQPSPLFMSSSNSFEVLAIKVVL